MGLEVVKTLDFSSLQHHLFWESNNANDIIYVGFSHQIMQLKILAIRIKDQVTLTHLGISLFYE
jgi:hypothetical protein